MPRPPSPADEVKPDGGGYSSGGFVAARATADRATADRATADWATADWAGEAAEMYSLLPDVAELTATVNFSVAVAPRREVSLYWRYEDGRPVEGGVGLLAGSELALSANAEDAGEIFSGSVPPSVAFMRGRLKAAGDGGVLLAFLRSTTDPRFADWCTRMVQLTKHDRSA